MNSKISLLISGLILLMAFSSCKTERDVYMASKPNIPFFKEQGEAKISGAYSSTGVDVQAAYALSDHIAVTADGTIGIDQKDDDRRTPEGDKSNLSYKTNRAHVGLGYFFPLNEQETVTFNAYGGVGIGKYEITESIIDSSATKNYEAKLFDWYLQPSINFIINEHFHIAAYYKASFVNYGNVNTTYTPNEIAFFGFDEIHNKSIIYSEFGYDLEVKIPGLSWLYLEHTLGITPTPNKLKNTRLVAHNVTGSIGLTAKF